MRVLCTMLSGVPAAPGAPVIPAANISPLFNAIEAESGAAGHWVFGSDNAGMFDLVSGQEAQTGWTFTVTAGGSGYTSAPTVEITGGGGSGMSAEARIASGTVAQVQILNPGSGYTSAPTVTLSGGGGTGATATVARATSPTVSGSHMTTALGVNGVLLPLLDEAVQTLCVVVRTPADDVNAAFIGAASSNASTFAGGDLIYKQLAEHRINTRPVGDVLMTNADGVTPGSTWTFLALSQSATTRTWMMGGAAASSGAAVKTAAANRCIAVGNAYLTGFAAPFDIAEAIVFRSAKTEAELNAIYARRKAQLVNAGVSVL